MSPIDVGAHRSGYLVILAPTPKLGERERIAAERGALACALELAKEHAIAETENRLRGDFVDELLQGRAGDEQSAITRARHLGYDLTMPHVALVLQPQASSQIEVDEVLSDLADTIATTGACRPLTRIGNSYLTIFYPLRHGLSSDEAERAIKSAIARANSHWPGVAISCGVGRYHRGLDGLRKSYREAEQALAIGRSLFGPGCIVSFGKLGVYRLIFLLHQNPELDAYYREVLGSLTDYDARKGTELVHTLEVYFACQGNIQKTAETLYLHRNSLAYRLRRIKELTGLDPDDLEDRFQLQLALKIRRALQGDKP